MLVAVPGISPAARGWREMMLTMLLQLWLTQAGCTKDTDCKGDRICEAGVCVSPKAPVEFAAPAFSAPPPPPPPPPAPTAPSEEWPKVVRRDGLVCVQAPGANGQIEESCRMEKADPVVVPTSKRPRTGRRSRGDDPERPGEQKPAGRFVMDLLLQGGLALLSAQGASLALPQFTGQLAFGGRSGSGIGFVGLGQVQVMGNARILSVVATIAPGLRFGDRSHFTLAAGPSYLGYGGAGGGGSGLMGSILAQGVFAVAEAFGLTLHGGLHFDASGVIFTIGGGFGFGAF